MIRSVLLLVSVFCVTVFTASAQRLVGTDTLYGNEWLEAQTDYLRIATVKAGVYQIDHQSLLSQGWTNIIGGDLSLFFAGQEVPIYTTTEQAWSSGDFFEFVVSKDDVAAYESELFEDGLDDMLNPDVALFSDTAVYFLRRDNKVHARYSVSSNSPNSVQASNTALAKANAENQTQFVKRDYDAFGQSYSSFRPGEGWSYGQRSSITAVLEYPGYVPGSDGTLALFTLSTFNSNPTGTPRPRILNAVFGSETILSDTVDRGEFLKYDIPVSNSLFAGSSNVVIEVIGAGGTYDRFAVGRCQLTYEANLKLVANEQTIRYPKQVDLNAGTLLWEVNFSDTYRVYETSGRRVVAGVTADTFVTSFPSMESNTKLVLTSNSSSFRPIIQRVRIEQPNIPFSTNYLIITSKELDSWTTTPIDYAAFRSNTLYGGYNVEVLYVEDIVNQFGYGAINDSRSVTNAIQYAVNNSQTKFVLVLGKGREFTSIRTAAQIADPLNASNYVPTFGVPGSDNLMGMNMLSEQLDVAIGRLPLESGEEVANLIRKNTAVDDALRSPQTIEEKAWMKRVLHLSGGKVGEQAGLASILRSLENIIVPSKFGADVYSFQKDSDQPIQVDISDELTRLLGEGASIVNLLGHASPGTFDFSIDNPDFYRENDRYPFLFGLGCYSGNLHLPGKSIGERFTLLENKGYVAFGATLGLGYPNTLSVFASDFYRAFGDDFYDASVGESFQVAINRAFSSSGTLRQLGEQFSFNGDPALRLYKHSGPDYIVDTESFQAGNGSLIVGDSTISLDFNIVNLGANTGDSIIVRIERETQARSRQVIDSFTVEGSVFSQNIVRLVESWGSDGAGLNNIWVSLATKQSNIEAPAPGAITNNQTPVLSFFIQDKSVDLLWPLDHTIIEADSLVLYTATLNPFSNEETYNWELSTSSTFSSIIEQKLTTGRGLMKWQPMTAFQSDQQYFWRVKNAVDSAESFKSSSFIVGTTNAQNSQTFNLSRPNDFALGTQDGLSVKSDGTWVFDSVGFFISIRNMPYDFGINPAFIFDFSIPASSVQPWDFATKGIAVCYGDPVSGGLQRNSDPALIGSIPTSGSRVFLFEDSRVGRTSFVNFIDNVIPDSAAVYVFSMYHNGESFDFANWAADSISSTDKTVAGVLEEQGALSVRNWVNGSLTVPYTFVFRKNVSPFSEEIGTNYTSEINTVDFIPIVGFEGIYTSIPLARGLRYNSLKYQVDPSRTIDSLGVSVIGYDEDGQATVLDFSTDLSTTFDLSQVAPEDYNRIVFQMYQRQAQGVSPVNLESITLEFIPLPELVYDPLEKLLLPSDTLDRGEFYTLEVAITNVGTTTASEVLVEVTSLSTASPLVSIDTLGQLQAWETKTHRFSKESSSWPTDQRLLWTLRSESESERVVSNNFGSRDIKLNEDELAPLVSLQIDGEQIAPGIPLVSDPTFNIKILETNPYLRVDSSQIQITLVDPDGLASIVDFTDPNLLFIGNTVSNTTQTLLYDFKPENLVDGVYRIKVGMVDFSGNNESLQIEQAFEVANTTAVSAIVPYPNPGVDNIRFHYEATGVPPTDYTIDIYTSAGRLAMQLGPDQLGALQVGRNLTQGAWDGTDMFGKRLAKGLYLYRFKTQSTEGETDEHRVTSIDSWVEKGFGKLVLL